MNKVMIVLSVLILVGLTGCGESKEKNIVGKWKEVGGTQTIEFFKDGTVTVVDKGEPPLTGDYRFIDGNRIRMGLKGLGELLGPVVAEISASREEIALTNPFGKVEKYRRLGDEDSLRVKGRKETEKQKLSRKERRLLGKYTGQTDDGSRISFELKGDGICLFSSTGSWKIIWYRKDDPPYAPTLYLYLSNLRGEGGYIQFRAWDGEKTMRVTRGFICVDSWRGLRDEILLKHDKAELIRLDKIKEAVEEIPFPGEVKIWNKYASKGDGSILELKKMSRFATSGWKSYGGECDGIWCQYHIFDWEIKDNKIQLLVGENLIEIEIKGKTLVDKKEGITFVRQAGKSSFPVSLTRSSRPGSIPQKKEADPFGGEMIWIKCSNLDCEAEYQMSKKEYYEYIQEHQRGLRAPPLVCKKCGQKSIYRAVKCPKCGIVFFHRAAGPDDFSDRCPECGYSETEEKRKKARRERIARVSADEAVSSGITSGPVIREEDTVSVIEEDTNEGVLKKTIVGEYLENFSRGGIQVRDEILIINKDGTFTVKEREKSVSGRSYIMTGDWEINNDKIIFYIYTGQERVHVPFLNGRVEGNTIHSGNGTIWKKLK